MSNASEQTTEKNRGTWIPATRLGRVLFFGLMAFWLLFLFLPGGQWLTIVLVGLQWFARYVYGRMPTKTRENGKNKLLTHIFDISFVLTLFLLVVALGIWLIVSFGWTQRFQREEHLTLLAGDPYVTVALPSLIPANGEPQPVRVQLVNNTAMTQTVVVTLHLTNQDTRLVTPLGPLLLLEAEPGKAVSETLQLANNDPARGIRVRDRVVATVASGGESGIDSVQLNVQGTWGAHLSQFVTNTVDKSSPILILVAFLVPLVSAVIQKYVDKYEAEKDKAKAQKAEEEKERAKQRFVEVGRLRDRLRNHLRFKEINQAQAVYDEWANSEDLQSFFEDDRRISIALLKLATTKDLEEFETCIREGRGWPDACIATFVYAWEGCKDEPCIEKLMTLRDLLPVANASGTAQEALGRVDNEIAGRMKNREKVWALAPWPAIEGKLKPSENPWIQEHLPKKPDPFAYAQAEQDLPSLFFRGSTKSKQVGFWGGARFFKDLCEAKTPVLMWGEHGAGRTAAAYGLQHYQGIEHGAFVLHIPQTPQLNTIQTRVAAHLWHFIEEFPHHLRLLTDGELDVLAALLIQAFGSAIHGRVDATQAKLHGPKTEEDKKEKDKEIGKSQLLRLSKALKRPQPIDTFWPALVVDVAKSLGFKRVLLVLDVPETAGTWLVKDIIPHLEEWHVFGLQTILLLPNMLKSTVAVSQLPYAVQAEICWDKDQFIEMLEWRYKAIAGSRVDIRRHFDTGAFDVMVESCLVNNCYNPQRFVRLWQAIVTNLDPKDPKTAKITTDTIAAAVNHVGQAV